ncbi:MAG: hypothetical protein ACT4QF_08540 [Sporichthyaceae bacterium]
MRARATVAVAVGVALAGGTALVARADDATGTLAICLRGVQPNGEIATAEGPSRESDVLDESGCATWRVRPGGYDVNFRDGADPRPDPTCGQNTSQLVAAVAIVRPGMVRTHRHALVSGQEALRTNVVAGERTEVRYDIRPLCNAR